MKLSKINKKMDHDVTLNEFSLALDENILPKRYNKDLVETFFKLIEDPNQENSGLDLQSFIYYDFMYRLYHRQSKQNMWRLNITEFEKVLIDPMFPILALNSIKRIPEKDLTKENYQLFTYYNITNFRGEEDHLLSFLQNRENSKNSLYNKMKIKHKKRETFFSEL